MANFEGDGDVTEMCSISFGDKKLADIKLDDIKDDVMQMLKVVAQHTIDVFQETFSVPMMPHHTQIYCILMMVRSMQPKYKSLHGVVGQVS